MTEVCNLPQYPKQSCQTCLINEPVNAFFKKLPSGPKRNLVCCNSSEEIDNLPSSYQVYDQVTNPSLVDDHGHPVHPKKTILNEDFGLKLATDFVKVKCTPQQQYPMAPNTSLPKKCSHGYISHDPRTRNWAIGQTILLDAPPYTGHTPLQDIYSSKLTNYGQPNDRYGQYKSYKDIKAGQIQYYTTNELSDALFNPVFAIESEVDKSIFTDPMGSCYPNYCRRPLTNNRNNISGYQFDRDQMEFREDIISHQQNGNIYKRDYQKFYKE